MDVLYTHRKVSTQTDRQTDTQTHSQPASQPGRQPHGCMGGRMRTQAYSTPLTIMIADTQTGRQAARRLSVRMGIAQTATVTA
mmetsp:Transcript_27896/g.80310  ORF Transcript_27896/g.80310 Transcript_27896/m.80310 type:complete len:83 (-) Transcript_27896:256-504(-)